MKPCLIGEENIIENAMMIKNKLTKQVTEVKTFTSISWFQFFKDVNVIQKFSFSHRTIGMMYVEPVPV